MKRLVLLFILITCFGWASAQEVQIGPQFGINIADRHFIPERKRIGINAGGIANIQFSDLFSLRSGLLYSQKGSNGFQSENGKNRYNYLTMPLTPQLNFGDRLKFFVRAGGYAGVNVFAEAGGQALEGVKNYDLGAQAGTGVIHTCGKRSLMFDISYSLGATGLSPGAKGTGVFNNSVLAISAAYLFGLQ